MTSIADDIDRGPQGPRRREHRTTSDRRTRRRLRELCEEVLASHRVARGELFVTERERQDACALLGNLTPGLPR